MRLGDRLKQTDTVPDAPELTLPPPTDRSGDPFAELKRRAQTAMFARLGGAAGDPNRTEAELREFARRELAEILEAQDIPLSAAEKKRLVEEIAADVLGYGPLTPYLSDPEVTEVMANNTDGIFIERRGIIELAATRFSDDDHLRRVIERIVGAVGRRIDESSPMVDARLPDGSRVNAVLPPVSVDGPAITIRKFSKAMFGVDDLLAIGSATPEAIDLISACVEGKLNILVSGGTGTGKTTLLNLLTEFIPENERIVTIEDAVELRLKQRHVVRMEARPPNIEGKGEITIRDLVRNSLRMRPDRIIIGEVRGGEALDMLQAMNTGHEGSISTLHANTPRDAIARLETMVLMAGIEIPVRAIREQIASAIDVIVHLSRLRDGTRRVTQIVEVEGMENDLVTLNSLFEFDFSAGRDDNGRFLGVVRPTGIRPKFADHLHEEGIELKSSIFGRPMASHEAAAGSSRRRK